MRPQYRPTSDYRVIQKYKESFYNKVSTVLGCVSSNFTDVSL